MFLPNQQEHAAMSKHVYLPDKLVIAPVSQWTIHNAQSSCLPE